MIRSITKDDLNLAAARLRCDTPAIHAVIDIESAGAGFLGDGRPKILYEAHQFARLTGHAYDEAYPKLSAPKWDRSLYGSPDQEYHRLYAAMQLNADAALQACSWGLFQIMGFNWAECGEKSLMGFILGMHNNEGVHLHFFCQYVIHKGLDEALREHRWADFARGYNGAGYAQNEYDTRLATAWRAHGGH